MTFFAEMGTCSVFPYLIYAYLKSAQADLTQKQIKTLAQLMKDIDNG